MKKKLGTCPCCKRHAYLTFHHLIPKKLHRRPHFRKHYAKTELQSGVDICRTCHNGIHRFYTEMHLGKHLASLEALMGDDRLADYFAWVAKQKIIIDK